MGNIGALEIGILVLIVLLVFGPKRLPGIGRAVGGALREFKESVGGSARALKEELGSAPRELKEALDPMRPADSSESRSTERSLVETP